MITATTKTESIKYALMIGFFRIMGIGGWFMLASEFVANRVANTLTGNNTWLEILEVLILVTWVVSRWEHLVKELFTKKVG